MKIYVRIGDGFILNSYDINNAIDTSNLNYESIYDNEYYTVYDIIMPSFQDIEGLEKLYYYKDNEVLCVYSLAYDIDDRINALKKELESTDYVVIKLYESTLSQGTEVSQYNVDSIVNTRQNLRNKINQLEGLKDEYTHIETYRPDLLKSYNENINLQND